jgi:uridine kinase
MIISHLEASTILVGIAGGTGSGKTTFAEKIQSFFPDKCILISQDSYYKDLSHLSEDEKNHRNFDHPDSIDFALLLRHLEALREGKAVEAPIYLFSSHTRSKTSQFIPAKPLIIVEGILLFSEKSIRDLFDMKIFIATDDDIRLLRRIERDIRERGRDFASIKEQYLTTVKPMHEAFVEPSKRFADIIIPDGGYNEKGLSVIYAKLNEVLIDLELKK